MPEIIENDPKIENMIYEIRGRQVMLDSNLAQLYQVETKRINEAVMRNKEKFPDRFSWKLTEEENNVFWSQFATKKIETRGGRYKCPRVFTEQGVAMLSTILKSKVAIEVSIQIMDAFVAMRKYIATNNYNQRIHSIETKVIEHDTNIKLLQESFSKLEEKKKINEIYFEGQIWDSYSKIIDIFKTCQKELIIIDAYVDKTTLDLIKNLNISVTLIVKVKSLLSKIEIEKYQEQYNNLEIVYNDTFHDRYFILDKDIIYHCGTSLNYLGNKTFSINLLEDSVVKESLIKKIERIIQNTTK